MKIKKVLVLFFIFIWIATFCYANEMSLQASGELKENTTIEMKVNINIGELEEKVYFLQGKLEYDSKIFKKITAKDIELLNGWHDIVFNEDNGMFIVEGSETNESDIQEIMKIQLKTQNQINTDTATIKLKDLKEVGESQVEIELEDTSLAINKPQEKGFFSNFSDNLANKILPYTGGNPIILYGILTVIIILVVIFIIYKRKHKTK